MTDKEILQEYKRKYIDNSWSYNDGAKSLMPFFYKYFIEMAKKYKSYKPLVDRFENDDINIILAPQGVWYYEHNMFYYAITKQLDKKIKSILKSFNYKYLYDI